MEALDWLEKVFETYGYLVLLLGLPVDFIALPLPPGQTTLLYTGYLIYEGAMSPIVAFGSAFLGASLGVTATYTIGYQAGARLLDRFGRRLMIRPELLEKTRGYYERYGNRFLFVSFFIPGVRQFAGYAVGMLRVPLRTFAIYAYSGAACWTAAFIGIGYAFGGHWETAFVWVERYSVYVIAAFVAGAAVYMLLRRYGRRRRRNRSYT